MLTRTINGRPFTPELCHGDARPTAAERPTLAKTAEHVSHNLDAIHGLVDRIEAAIHGPAPAEACSPPKSVACGLESVLTCNAVSSASIAARLESLLHSIEAP